MYVLVLAADALRLANKYATKRVFDWVLISDDGRPIEASNGIRMDCDLPVNAAVQRGQPLMDLLPLSGIDSAVRIIR